MIKEESDDEPVYVKTVRANKDNTVDAQKEERVSGPAVQNAGMLDPLRYLLLPPMLIFKFLTIIRRASGLRFGLYVLDDTGVSSNSLHDLPADTAPVAKKPRTRRVTTSVGWFLTFIRAGCLLQFFPGVRRHYR